MLPEGRYSKVILVGLITALVLLSWAQPGLAHEDDWKLSENQSISGQQGSLGNTIINTVGNTISWMLSLPITGLARAILWLSDKAGLYSIRELVFAEGRLASGGGGIFSPQEWENVIMPWYRVFFLIASAGVFYSLVITWTGYRTLAASISPQRAVSFSNTLLNILIAMLFMTQMPLFLNLISDANAVIVGAIKNSLISHGLYNNLATLDPQRIGNTFANPDLGTQNPLLNSLILLGLAGFTLTINFLYMIRKFVVGVLIVISPIVAWALLSSRRTPFLLMLSEIVSNTFMSASHAVVLAFYLSMLAYNGDGMFATWWAKLFALYMLIPTASLLRRLITGWFNLLGIDEEAYAGIAAAGVGSLVAAAAIVTGVLNGRRTSMKQQPKPPQEPKRPPEEPEDGGQSERSSVITTPAMTRAGENVFDKFGESVVPSVNTPISTSGNKAEPQIPASKAGFKDVISRIMANEDKAPKYPTGIPLPRERKDPTKPESEGITYSIPDPELLAKEKLYDKYEPLHAHELPSLSAANYRDTSVTKDRNMILGPAGVDGPSYREIIQQGGEGAAVSGEGAAVSKDKSQASGWLTLENIGKVSRPILSAAGKAAVLTGAFVGGAAGAAFGMGMGNAAIMRTLQEKGAVAGAWAPVALGRGFKAGGTYAIKAAPVVRSKVVDVVGRLKARNPSVSALDKPSLK